MFTVNQAFKEVLHITDAMGVSFTLIEGSERAILFDTGYGMEDVKSFIGTLTGKPVSVLLSHGHHDHILGARWFDKTFLCSEDLQEFRKRTGKGQRKEVKRQADGLGVPVPDDFMTVPIATPEKIRFTDMTGPFERSLESLGNLEVYVIRVPGHTPGSIVLYVPLYDLLLTGDNWNPCTWMWFPSSAAANIWRDRMTELVSNIENESGREIMHVICSHQTLMRKGTELKGFLKYITDDRLANAPEVDMGTTLIDTHEISCEDKGWQLIFDCSKLKTGEQW